MLVMDQERLILLQVSMAAFIPHHLPRRLKAPAKQQFLHSSAVSPSDTFVVAGLGQGSK